jgi:hypothetical protein
MKGHIPSKFSLEGVRPGVLTCPSTLFGLDRLRRMIVVRLPTGGLMIHSATCLDEEQMQLIESEGPVELIVVPCKMHRLDAHLWKERFPEAKVVCPAEAKHAIEEKVHVDSTFEELFVPGNKYGVESFPVPKLGEAVLAVKLNPLSEERVWIVTDLLQNIDS